jgi:MFS transporter, MCT family, solute carrier family 16 (monocarboxylic acid transporters), member 10
MKRALATGTITLYSIPHLTYSQLIPGIAVTGASCGGIVFPIMLNILQVKIGWKESVRVSAGVVGVLLVVANCIMKTRVVVLKKSHFGGDRKQQTNMGQLSAILVDGAYIWSVAGYVKLPLAFDEY